MTSFYEYMEALRRSGASFEELGRTSIEYQRSALFKALDYSSKDKLGASIVQFFEGDVPIIVEQWIRYWGTLSPEEKTEYHKGVTAAVVIPRLPDLFDDLHKKFSAGQRTSLFAAIKLCAEFRVAPPAWAADAFLASYNRVERLEVDSWDAAFGRPKIAGQRLPEARKRRALLWQIAHRVDVVRNEKPWQSLDWTYAEVAAEFVVNIKFVRELYNRARKHKPSDGLERFRYVIPSDPRPRRKRRPARKS